MSIYKLKKSQASGKGNCFLITITVLGSTGPIRFFVNEEKLVSAVIDNALKLYAREGRLPVLGSDINDFVLYCPVAGTEALSPWDTIGSVGVRNFMLFKKPEVKKATEQGKSQSSEEEGVITRKGSGSWKAWLNKSLNLKISSH